MPPSRRATPSSPLRKSPLADAVDAAIREVPARRHIQSIVVAREGEIVLERYFRDRRPTDLSNLHSVTKSVVATLVGIAIGDGSLALRTPLGDFFDERLFGGDARKRQIRVEHLLTMTSGLDADTPHDIDEIADRGESWIGGPLAAPLRASSRRSSPVPPARPLRGSRRNACSRRWGSTSTAGPPIRTGTRSATD